MTPLQFEVQLRNYTDNRNRKTLENLTQILGSLSLAQLNDFCLQNETIRTTLQEPDFLPFWQRKMAGLKLKGRDDFAFRATKSLSPMDVTLGYFNYLQAVKANIAGKADEETSYIAQALKFHSYHALNYYYQEIMIQLKNDDKTYDIAVESISFFEEEARWHGTPGYLVVAKLYFGFAEILIKWAEEPNIISVAFQMVIKNLRFAELMEEKSVEDIHNAYFARGLAQCHISKPASIADLRQACITSAGIYLRPDDIAIATHAAEVKQPTRAKPIVAREQSSLSGFYQAILADSPTSMRVIYTQEMLESKSSSGENTLLFAVRHGKIDAVRCLLSLGANPASSDSQGNTALTLAIELGHQGIARLLVKAKPELLDEHLVTLISEEKKQLINVLDKIPQKSEIDEWTRALNGNSDSKLRECLENGIGPDVILASGKTSLAHLFATQNTSQIELLLEFGVSLTQVDMKGEPILFAIMDAIESQDSKIYFQRFVSLGADINAQNKEGETLLIKAAKRGDLPAITFLLDQENIDVNLKDGKGRTALDYAGDNQWISDLLVEHKAEKAMEVERPLLLSFVPNQILRFFGLPSEVTESSAHSLGSSSRHY